MKKLKYMLSSLLVLGGLLLTPLMVKAAPPSGTLSVNVENYSTYYVRVNGTFSDANDWAATLDWGDGSTVAFPGLSGTYEEFHWYPGAGTYNIGLTVNGPEGTVSYSNIINLYPVVNGTFDVYITNPQEKEVAASAFFDSSNDWGATVYWGDNSSITFPGTAGGYSVSHQFASAELYTVSFVIEGRGGPVVINKDIDFRVNQVPVTAAMDLIVINEPEKMVQVTGDYQNSTEWGTTIYWGHDNSLVSYQLKDGNFAETHQFPGPGTYTVSLVSEGMGGPVVINRDVTFLADLVDPATGTMDLLVIDPASRTVQVSGNYDNSRDWGTTVYWGHDDLSVSYPGENGYYSETHQFPGSGTYTVTLVVEGVNGPYTINRSVSFF